MGFFSSDKITKEMLEKIANSVEAIAKSQEEQALKLDIIEKAQKNFSAKLDEIDKRLSSLEDLTAKNFSSVIAQTELLLERLEFITSKSFSTHQYAKILPQIKSLIDNMNEQIQLTPLNEIEIDNLSDSDKLLVAMVKEIEKITKNHTEYLAEAINRSARGVVRDIGKKVDNKNTEIRNGIVRNLETVQHNLELAIWGRKDNGVSADQIRRIVKEETRQPGSRNSYL